MLLVAAVFAVALRWFRHGYLGSLAAGGSGSPGGQALGTAFDHVSASLRAGLLWLGVVAAVVALVSLAGHLVTRRLRTHAAA